MPWRETSAMDERLRFVRDVHRPGWSIADLCRRYELWNVYFGPVWLGRFHEAVGRSVDQLDRPVRRRGGNHKETPNKVLPIT